MITKEQFMAYESVRRSGRTNMFDTIKVMQLSHFTLSREQIIEIMKNYSELKKQYLEEN